MDERRHYTIGTSQYCPFAFLRRTYKDLPSVEDMTLGKCPLNMLLAKLMFSISINALNQDGVSDKHLQSKTIRTSCHEKNNSLKLGRLKMASDTVPVNLLLLKFSTSIQGGRTQI